MIPPGCCPVVLFTPVHPIDNLCISALFTGIPLSSKYPLTYPNAVFSATVPTVPALNVVPFPNITSVYLWAFAWYSPEKFKSISGSLSPIKS